jgi:hypothetical protein
MVRSTVSRSLCPPVESTWTLGPSGSYSPQQGHHPRGTVGEPSRGRDLDTRGAFRVQYSGQRRRVTPGRAVGCERHYCCSHHPVQLDRAYTLKSLRRFRVGRAAQTPCGVRSSTVRGTSNVFPAMACQVSGRRYWDGGRLQETIMLPRRGHLRMGMREARSVRHTLAVRP